MSNAADVKVEESFYERYCRLRSFSMNYLADGFIKVCDVGSGCIDQWHYININKDVMFSEHHGWIYMIVCDDLVAKIGETERRLGIPGKGGQPKKGTACRLGRLRSGDDTDRHIRSELNKSMQNGSTVSIWARPCPTVYTTNTFLGKQISVPMTANKFYEKIYMEDFKNRVGQTPDLNRNSR